MQYWTQKSALMELQTSPGTEKKSRPTYREAESIQQKFESRCSRFFGTRALKDEEKRKGQPKYRESDSTETSLLDLQMSAG